MKRFISLDAFCLRQFDKSAMGTKIDMDKDAFINKVNELWHSGKFELTPGYAPFCKHLFVPNFCGAMVSELEITPENEGLLKSGYLARTEKELPVLARWFDSKSVKVHEAKYLDLILYSREQILIENEKMNSECTDEEPWGLISVKAQDLDSECIMNPITMIRNALGMSEGGSGVSLNRENYKKSVEYWSKHAIVM